jgi:hypothetical protein
MLVADDSYNYDIFIGYCIWATHIHTCLKVLHIMCHGDAAAFDETHFGEDDVEKGNVVRIPKPPLCLRLLEPRMSIMLPWSLCVYSMTI